jgi:hypothetical protein
MALKTKLYSMHEVRDFCKAAGFSGDNLAIAIAVIWAESGGNAWAVNINSTPGKPTDGSIDLGICQWNSYWWPLITPAKAMDPQFAIKKFYEVSKGTNFSYWNAFVSGAHKKFLSYAQAVATQI